MIISIVDRRRLLNQELRDLAERRLLFALSRFSSKLARVDLVVQDENGPRGGIDKACRVSVSMHRCDSVVITDKDSDFATVLSRVAERVGRAVGRTISKSQRFDRTRPEFIEE